MLNLPNDLYSEQQAADYLHFLYEKGLIYHPEEDATEIIWDGEIVPTKEQQIKMNELMDEVWAFIEDPCGVVLSLIL